MINKQVANIPWYAEFEFESMNEFLQWKINQCILSLDKFIFRGHSKSSYKLIPSALRQDEHTHVPQILNYHPTGMRADMAALIWGNIIECENNLLSSFFKEANKQGLFVPTNQNISNNYLMRYYNQYIDKLDTWYDNEMLESAALAQHYGIPTQMLDWTFNVNVAFYFALKGVVKNLYEKKEIENTYTIWGISAENIAAYLDDFNKEYRCPIKFYVPNYIGNEHLKLQKGVLSYKQISNFQSQRFSQYKEEPFDEVLLDYFHTVNSEYRNLTHDGIQLFKMTFPSQAAVDEFDRLSKDGFNAASIFSGYDGVIQKFKEDEWIRKLKRSY